MADESTIVEKRRADSIEVGVEEPPRAELIDLATALAFSPCADDFSSEHAILWERLLCEHFRIVQALREFPRQFSDAASAYGEWRRLGEHAKAGDRRRRVCTRTERQWMLMRALESCEPGLRSLLLGRADEAFRHCGEASDWAAPGIEAAVRMRNGRAARARGLDLDFVRMVARAYQTELPKARQQVAAERLRHEPAVLERLAGKRARKVVRGQLKLPGEAGRKRISRALARAGKIKADD